MFCGKFRAPITLPSYVHMQVMNSSFYAPCNFRNLVSLFSR